MPRAGGPNSPHHRARGAKHGAVCPDALLAGRSGLGVVAGVYKPQGQIIGEHVIVHLGPAARSRLFECGAPRSRPALPPALSPAVGPFARSGSVASSAAIRSPVAGFEPSPERRLVVGHELRAVRGPADFDPLASVPHAALAGAYRRVGVESVRASPGSGPRRIEPQAAGGVTLYAH